MLFKAQEEVITQGMGEASRLSWEVFFPRWLYVAGRFVLGGVFLWSGMAKLQDMESFAVIIGAFGLLPEMLVDPASLALPLLEVVAGLGLLLDVRGSLGGVAGMLLLFMAVLAYGLHLGLDVDCGCFGPGDPEGEAFHNLRPALHRDAVMMAGVVYLYTWRLVRRVRPVRLTHYLTMLKKGTIQ